MSREIVKLFKHPNSGGALLVRDPHDGSGRERWFVEVQMRFEDESEARAFFEDLVKFKQFTAEPR